MGCFSSKNYASCDTKVILVTGGTAGIGRESVKKFVELGATVIFTGRSQEKADNILNELSKDYPNSPKTKFLKCDVEDLNSVKQVAQHFNQNYERLDVLLNNIGAIVDKQHNTIDNFDASFQVNHLNGFYLTSLLFNKLKHTENSRVINVSSRRNLSSKILDLENIKNSNIPTDKYAPFAEYSYGKLLNVIYTKGLDN